MKYKTITESVFHRQFIFPKKELTVRSQENRVLLITRSYLILTRSKGIREYA